MCAVKICFWKHPILWLKKEYHNWKLGIKPIKVSNEQ